MRKREAKSLSNWFLVNRLGSSNRDPFLCASLFFAAVKMNSMIYAWLCSLTVAFGGFMWGYEAG